ncbi:hypothetical protein RUM43_014363 [Polyplax serrata]|uniref:Uncharacterized protein n=1 Tax=Polyplax serrata TaxID=468196 RepID=A0AAN8S6Q3_POLSC
MVVSCDTDVHQQQKVERKVKEAAITFTRTASKNPASDEKNNYLDYENKRIRSPIFRSYEEELEHRLEHNPSPTESELLQDLENEFGEELTQKHNRERICFLERSASFNSDRCGQQGAFVRYPNINKPKRSSSFCAGTTASGGKSTSKPLDHAPEKKLNGEENKKYKKLLRCKSFEGQIDTTSESEDCIDIKARKRFSDAKKREKRKAKKDRKVVEKSNSVTTTDREEEGVANRNWSGKVTTSGSKEGVFTNNSENNSKEVTVPKPASRNKPAPIPPKRVLPVKAEDVKITQKSVYLEPQANSPKKESEIKVDRFKTTVTLPVLESEEEKSETLSENPISTAVIKLEKAEDNSKELKEKDHIKEVEDNNKAIKEKEEKVVKEGRKALVENGECKLNKINPNQNKKGALQKLYEDGLKKIQEKHSSESGADEKITPDCEPDNPFREQEPSIGLTNYVVKRPQTLKIRVGFESPAIGQDLDTPPSLANTSEKTLPYYLKSQESKVLNGTNTFGNQNCFRTTGRCENNIEYEKSVELGKNLIKVEKPSIDKNTEKVLQEAEVERRIVQVEIEKLENQQEELSKPPTKKSLKKLDLSRKKKAPKPDYSNEIREEVEPITPDTDQSEIEEILETFSRELKNSDVNEILSGDESRQKRSPPALRETAFLPSASVKCNAMPQPSKETLTKTSSLPTPVAKTRDQVLKTAMLRKEARPNSLPLRNGNGLPNTSLTLENYVERRKMNYPPSGRVSAPLFKEYQSPGYMSGRRSVPVDHERNIIPERNRILPRNRTRAEVENICNGNFQRNLLRTRSLTRDASKGYLEPKSDVQRQVIYESNIPKSINNKLTGPPQVLRRPGQSPPVLYNNRDSDRYSASEIEAVFWERLRQKKIRESLREQELLQKTTDNGSVNFVRNAPERSTIGPIYQSNSDKIHREQNGGVYHQEKSAKNREPVKTQSEAGSQNDLTGKRKKDEKGFSISKIPFFRRKSKSGSKDDSYKRASEDYEDYQGNHVSNSSLDESDTINSGKKVSFDKTDNARCINKNELGRITNRPYEKQLSSDSDVFLPNSPTRLHPSASRPLPPLPRDTDGTGYGVILRNKENVTYLQNQKPEIVRTTGADIHRASPFQETHATSMSPSRNMGIIHENELYNNTKLRESDAYFIPKFGTRSQTLSDTESGSEAGEIQRILHGVDKRQYSGGEFPYNIHLPYIILNYVCLEGKFLRPINRSAGLLPSNSSGRNI